MAWLFIQQAIDKSRFLCIAGASNSKEAWDALQKKYQNHRIVVDESSVLVLPLRCNSMHCIAIFSAFGNILSAKVEQMPLMLLNGHNLITKNGVVRRACQKKRGRRAKKKSVPSPLLMHPNSKKRLGNASFWRRKLLENLQKNLFLLPLLRLTEIKNL
nr:uncharacterized protein LOC109160086 isoform X4 [Ipomoea batatas]